MSDILYASRDLDLLYLPPGFHSPYLDVRWYWRCDLTFLSWLNGVIARNPSRLTATHHAAVNFIKSYIAATYGITDDNRAALTPAPGAKLDTSLLNATVGLCDRYAAPAWDGIAECAAAIGYADPLREDIFAPDKYADRIRAQEYAAKRKKKP